MDEEKLFNRLGIIQTENEIALITMKKKSMEAFVADVSDFLYDEDDTKVVLSRNDKTTFFPNDEDTFTTYIKNISTVYIYEE